MLNKLTNFFAVLLLAGLANTAQATVIYDFTCDDPTCGGIADWGGYIEVTDAAVANGSLTGTTDIVAFLFESPDPTRGPLTWTLSDLVTGIFMAFSGDGSTITTINDNSDTSQCTGSGSDACFIEMNAVDALFIGATSVNDVFFNSQSGSWIARNTAPTVAEPATLALLGMGLLGFGLARRKA